MKTRFISFISGITVVAVGLISIPIPSAEAANAADFRAGRIIDDSIFFNKDDYSISDIQNFFNTQVQTCEPNHARISTTPASESPPWRCLRDYYENPGTHENNLDGRGVPAGGVSAAQIIYNSAQNYGINPKALIVLLQKEQGIVTDTWPYDIQYRSATGYGCPDGGDCAQQYYGFYNQVNRAAFQFRRYATYPSEYNYRAGQTNNIPYSPTSGCGTKPVYIENQATAGLYNYTPYTPNQAALNNLYQTGDGCSAYGNRNFWRLYTDWFGSTLNNNRVIYAGQSSYPNLDPGTNTASYFLYKNNSGATWYDSTSVPVGGTPLNLATSGPTNRSSLFGSTWGGNQNRPATTFAAVYEADGTTLAANQHQATNGQIVKFNFTLSAPANAAPGVYRELFRPVLEGTPDGGLNDPGTYLDITVDASYVATLSTKTAAPSLKPGQTAPSYISYKNDGTGIWYDDLSVFSSPGANPTHLATSHAMNRSSVFGDDWGANKNRPALLFNAVYEADGTTLGGNQHIAFPGQIAKFKVDFKVPNQQAAATTREYFQLVQEGTLDGNMNDPNTYFDVAVLSSSVGAATITSENQASLAPRGTKQYTVGFTNIGNTTWTPSTTKLVGNASTPYQDFKDSSWASNTVVASVNQSTVAPGATGTFTFTIAAPNTGDSYYFELAPASDGAFASPTPAKFRISVSDPTYNASFAGQSSWPSLQAGSTATGFFQYKNVGNIAWHDDTSIGTAPAGSHPVHLATTHPLNRMSPLGAAWGANKNRPAADFSAVYEADGTTPAGNQHVVQPGQIAKFNFTFTAAADQNPGVYREYFMPVAEGTPTGAFNDPGTYLEVTVAPKVYAAQFTGQSSWPTVARGGNTTGFFKYKNVGNVAWYDDSSVGGAPAGTYPVHLATASPINRSSAFGTPWGGNRNRPALTFSAVYEADGTTLGGNQHVVQPGQIVQMSFALSVPAGQAYSTYREYFMPVAEGTPTGAFNNPGTYLEITVAP